MTGMGIQLEYKLSLSNVGDWQSLVFILLTVEDNVSEDPGVGRQLPILLNVGRVVAPPPVVF